jgi:hypothetical protein
MVAASKLMFISGVAIKSDYYTTPTLSDFSADYFSTLSKFKETISPLRNFLLFPGFVLLSLV